MTDLTMGQRIAECRRRLNLSQEALGEKMGVSRQAISKWEADGAVPEIDKLIALSKLFGVSVGWLLGVEETPEPSSEQSQGEISEELLRKIEEIVLRYRPRKEKMSTNKKVMVGILAALIIGVGCMFFTEWGIISNTVAYVSGQVRTNNEQNAMIMDQLSELESRIDGTGTQPEGFALSEYHFDIEPHEKDASAILNFTAVPSSWHMDYKATLIARYDKKDYLSQACAWDGSGIMAVMPIKIQDGYEYWLRVEYPDGSQEQMKLTDEYAENLETSFTIEIKLLSGTSEFDLALGRLKLKDYEVNVARPYVLDVCDNFVYFKSVELLLYHVDSSYSGDYTLVDTYPLHFPDGEEKAGERQIHHMTDGIPEHTFLLPVYNENDSFELVLRVEMSNGLVTEKTLHYWTSYLGEGEFREVRSALEGS